MKNESFSICYFPTNVIFVDDNQRFLKSVKFKIDKNQHHVLYDNPEKALLYLQSEYKSNQNIGIFSDDVESYDSSQIQSVFNFNVGKIVEHVLNPSRFDEISVLVTDYSMPTIDGIAFCKKIKHLPIKKILVTGEADEALAVAAFNEGIIDRFIFKNDPNFDAILKKYIEELKHAYFQEMTKNALNVLDHNKAFCFKNPALMDVFNKVLTEKNIVEYYLLNTTGSSLLLDENANTYWFIVQNEEDRGMYLDFAEDNEAPEALISELESGKKIIYLSDTDNTASIQGEEWESVAYPATKLDESICYSLTKNISDSKIDTSKIISFADYLEKTI